MKTIIAGSREITDYSLVRQAVLESQFELTEIISGGARGVDSLGERYACESNIPIKRFLPDWNKYGKKAGILRNQDMGDYADSIIPVWHSKIKGLNHMIDLTKKEGAEEMP